MTHSFLALFCMVKFTIATAMRRISFGWIILILIPTFSCGLDSLFNPNGLASRTPGQRLEDLEKQKNELTREVGVLAGDFESLKLEAEVAGSTEKVSFLVRLTTITTVPANATIIFTDVVQNVGNAYDNVTGMFTAPVSGIYLFHISATSRYIIDVNLVLDDDTVLATAWAYLGLVKDVQGSNMAVVYMRQSQKVWARFLRGQDRLQCRGYTQFTGTLLRKD